MVSIGAKIRHLVCLTAGIGLLSAQSLAQQAPVGPDGGVARSVVEARLKEVQESTELAVERRDELTGLYRQALGFIETQRSHDLAAAAFEQARADAPTESRRIRAENELARTDAPEITLDLPADVDAPAVEQRFQQARANRAAASERLGAITQELAAESNRLNLVRQRLVAARQTADELAGDLQLLAPAGENPLLTEASRWVLSANASAITAEIRMLDEELLGQPVRHELLEAQREQTSRSLRNSETRVLMLEDRLAAQRSDQTAQIIAETELATLGEAGENDVVRELAERNRELSAQLEFLTDAIEKVTTDIILTTEMTRRIQLQFQTAQQRMEIMGLNQALGRLLHEQRRDFPSHRDYRRKAQDRNEAIVAGGLREIQYDAELIELQDHVAYLDSKLTQIPESEWDTVREPLNELITARRTLMSRTLSANNTYFHTLGEQDFEEQQLIRNVDEFNTFLDRRLMWVRSADLVGLTSLQMLPQEIAVFLAREGWIDATGALMERLFDEPFLGLALVISILLLWQAGAVKEAVRATGRFVGDPLRDSYGATIKALGLSVLLILPWPLITAVTGWELNRSDYTTDGTRAIGAGLIAVATFLIFLLSARTLCLDDGVAQAHFRWPPNLVKGVRRELNRLLLAFTIPGFVLVVTIQQHPTNLGGELSRLMFIVATVASFIFFVRLLKPGTGVLNELAKRHDAGAKLPTVWLLFGAGIPAAMIVAALAGFLYSASTLMRVLIETLWLMLGLIFAHEMISRWLIVIRQRLMYQVQLKELEAARAASRGQAEGPGEGEEIPLPEDEPMVDATNLDTDAHKLLNMSLFIALIIGLTAIWSPVFPALTIFGNVELWTYHEGPAGAETIVPVTVANLGMVLIILLATIFATRSVPSLLEVLLRQRTALGAGSRLAFATLARYIIVLVGIIFISDSIGFQWSQIQWLVAALGVGIGFGLQEIIANFISGLIILMERPIRIGDVVTIGDISGKVTRLQIRATTITNWDRQELLVPNKEFITGRVLNWTLSDEVVRVVTTVGVSYGTDLSKAMELVREAAEESDYVLEKPGLLITFDQFGDNSLEIMLRCFIESPAYRREAKSALNLAIDKKFRDAGIVVAFPQRDIHLDTERPLDIRIHEGAARRGEK